MAKYGASRTLSEATWNATLLGPDIVGAIERLKAEPGKTGVTYLIIKPGRREAFAHRHREAEEVYVVLAGSGRVKLDDELVDLAELDSLRVGSGTARQLEAGPDGLEILIFGSHVEGDVEQVSDFWTG
jgi:mannose-6-phosphate isomerase-like protein (cupin superfamily)